MKHGLNYLVCMLLGVLFSCSEALDPQPNKYSEIFTGTSKKAWQISSIQLKEENKSPQTFGLPPCMADDEYIFYANVEKTYEISNGFSKCDSAEPDMIVSDSWEFSNANATMNIIMPLLADYKLPFIVREASEKEMTLEIFLDEKNTTSYRFNFTAKKGN
ncbi:MAG TPA: hypothetical protein VF490_05970 [Chryseosolibacter sp.]